MCPHPYIAFDQKRLIEACKDGDGDHSLQLHLLHWFFSSDFHPSFHEMIFILVH